jgi:colanic acid/amylovoran biosynthesis glycosyltransferase
MEAMARGRPVVATRIAAIPELVVAGCSGWVVPPARADLLADAVGELLQASPAELAAMGAAGRAKVEQAHDCAREAGVLLAAMRGAGLRG